MDLSLSNFADGVARKIPLAKTDTAQQMTQKAIAVGDNLAAAAAEMGYQLNPDNEDMVPTILGSRKGNDFCKPQPKSKSTAKYVRTAYTWNLGLRPYIKNRISAVRGGMSEAGSVLVVPRTASPQAPV